LGWTQHLAGEGEAAAKTLWQAIALKPRLVEAANALGIVYLVRGELSSAILTHQWATHLKANNEIAAYNLSLAYQLEKEFGLAIAYAKIAIDLEPQNPHPLISLAISHWEDGNSVEAKLAFQRAINLDSRYRNSQFLDFLQEAGFSNAQILTALAVLIAVS
jgi:Flp pilus assembly protein TadD